MPTVVASGQNAYISFTDGAGTAQLVTAAGRFDNWTPNEEDIGASDVAIGTGFTYKAVYRTDYTATFDIRNLPASTMAVAMRLKRWLESGQSCVVATQDLSGNTYACVIKPKGTIGFTYDRTLLEYTMSIQVKNTAGAPMLCLYSPSLGTGYRIVVSPNSLSLGPTVGQSAQLAATIFDPQNNPVTGVPVLWSSTDQSVATVDVTGRVAAVGSGACQIIASIGSTSSIVPCTVQILNLPASMSLNTGALAFTATTYTGTPQVGVSGVPAQTLIGTVVNGSGVTLPVTPGILTWTVTGTGATIKDNGDGTCTVTAVKGSQTGTITATVASTVGTPNLITASATYSTVAGQPVKLVPSSSVIDLTAIGQSAPITLQTIDQYGVLVP